MMINVSFYKDNKKSLRQTFRPTEEYCNIDFIDDLDQGENVALLDADKLKFPLRVRRWQEGDWFIPFGMSGRKKLSDYLIDKLEFMPGPPKMLLSSIICIFLMLSM